MTLEFLQQNWAILAASVLGTAVALFVAYRAFDGSARGQLLRAVRLHQARRQAATKAQRVADKVAARLQKLHTKRDSAKPRHIQEGAEALEDAEALRKIAQDQVLIAANHVRKIILEEYPPKRHARLRARYLPEDEPDKKPFTF
jgi:hypothetical protein